jgi:hypothetical protein
MCNKKAKCKMNNFRKFNIFIIILSIFVLRISNVSGQSLPVDFFIKHITFENQQSLRIPNNIVRIDIEKKNDNKVYMHVISKPSENDAKWNKTKIDTTYELDTIIFKQILREVLKITKIDVVKAITIGNDGALCTLGFGCFENDISFRFWCPDYETKERGLNDFINACNIIIKTAKLKPKDVY